MANKKFVSIFLVLLSFLTIAFTGCKKNDKMFLNYHEITVNVDYTKQLKVVNVGEREVEWVALDTAIATVTKNGLVKGISNGQTKVRATVDGITFECVVKVTLSNVSVPELKLNENTSNGDYIITIGKGALNAYTLEPYLTGVEDSEQLVYTLSTQSTNVRINGLTVEGVNVAENVEVVVSCKYQKITYTATVIFTVLDTEA